MPLHSHHSCTTTTTTTTTLTITRCVRALDSNTTMNPDKQHFRSHWAPMWADIHSSSGSIARHFVPLINTNVPRPSTQQSPDALVPTVVDEIPKTLDPSHDATPPEVVQASTLEHVPISTSTTSTTSTSTTQYDGQSFKMRYPHAASATTKPTSHGTCAVAYCTAPCGGSLIDMILNATDESVITKVRTSQAQPTAQTAGC
jgi:hypothetical protein